MGNRRFEMFEYRQVLLRMRGGDSDREIARAGLMGRKKLRKLRRMATAEGWLEADRTLPENSALAVRVREAKPRESTVSLVEPYRAEVQQWHEQGIDGTTIHQALVRKHGFGGSYSSVRRFLQGLASSQPAATTILDFGPGQAAQVDFGQGPKLLERGEMIGTWFFVMTLCWSRHQYAELVRNQKLETWLGCHRRALESFGGAPETLTIDNPRCAITRACRHDPAVQRSYAELAEGYGFKVDACPPRRPELKGRVEAGVKYVKRSFQPLREFRSLADANRQLEAWVRSTAGQRLHGTTRQRPLTRFAETERHLLRDLPSVAPEPAVWASAKLAKHCHVQFEQCRYSAPYLYVGEQLWLRATPSAVQIYRDHELVASHPRLGQPGERSTIEDHMPPEAVAFKRQNPDWCRAEAQAVGPCCQQLIARLFAHRVLDNLRAAQGLLRLGKRYGTARLEAACQRALAFDTPQYRSVKVILEKGLDEIRTPELAFDELAEPYTGAGRFCRDTRTLLTH